MVTVNGMEKGDDRRDIGPSLAGGGGFRALLE